MHKVHIIGAGLAGSEAAWQAAELGVDVVLHEMRPVKMTPAHQTGHFAELVCSNSLKSQQVTNAAGLLKEELRRMNSLILHAADQHQLPAGQALAVDRELFASSITSMLHNHPRIQVIAEEVISLPSAGADCWVIASGPLTSEALARSLAEYTGQDYLHFYDAVAPIVTLDSIDMSVAFRASRYDKGDADYINCPMDRDQYQEFYQQLCVAEQHPQRDFEKALFFEGCLPIEELARRGQHTLAYGPMKPIGLTDPRTGRYPHAAVQLRQDNAAGDLYNLVGFQTNLRYGEQERIFRLIPGLENAEFVRYGVMHQNLFLNSPVLLNPSLQMKAREDLLAAGQITGVEGYIESAATGWLAGTNAARILLGQSPFILPPVTMLGALVQYITTAESKHFQPMNAVFGIMPALPEGKRNKKQRQEMYAERALQELSTWQTLVVTA